MLCFSRRKLLPAAVIVLVIAAGAVLLLSRGRGKGAERVYPGGNEGRVTYLEKLGWQVEPEPLETLQFLLPETLEEPYLTYNGLQKSQGFDLSACCGKQVTRYTYTVTNYPGRSQGVQANLYICEDRPAAGDIFCAGADGFQEGLAFPKS